MEQLQAFGRLLMVIGAWGAGISASLLIAFTLAEFFTMKTRLKSVIKKEETGDLVVTIIFTPGIASKFLAAFKVEDPPKDFERGFVGTIDGTWRRIPGMERTALWGRRINEYAKRPWLAQE